MALKVSREDVWSAAIEDKPGAGAEKLAALAAAGINLETVSGRRSRSVSGGALLAVSPIKGAAHIRAAKKAGFAKSDRHYFIRIEGTDKTGRCADVAGALGNYARLNLAAMTAIAIGRKFACYIMLDSKADAAKAARILRKL